jgi:hypothetical protein
VRYEVCVASSWFSFDTGYTEDTDAPSRWFQPATKSSVKGACVFRDEPLQRGPPGCPTGPCRRRVHNSGRARLREQEARRRRPPWPARRTPSCGIVGSLLSGGVSSFGHVSAFALNCWPIDQDGDAHAVKTAAEFHAAERIGPQDGRCRVGSRHRRHCHDDRGECDTKLFSIMALHSMRCMRNEIRRGRRNGFGRRPANGISGWADRRLPSSSTAHAGPQLRLQPANDGHDSRAIQHYLGNRSTASMVRYTALAPDRFKEFWKD